VSTVALYLWRVLEGRGGIAALLCLVNADHMLGDGLKGWEGREAGANFDGR
jgi:hypothetical protein